MSQTAKPSLENASVPYSYRRILQGYLAEQGVAPADRGADATAPSRYPLLAWKADLERAAAQLDDPFLGLSLGQRIAPQHLGLIGHMVLACANLGRALAHWQRFQSLAYDVNPMRLDQHSPYIDLIWGTENGRPGALVDETAITGLVQFFRNLLADNGATPVAVDFVNPRPANTQIYRDWFGCTVCFECDHTRVRIPEAWLNTPLDSADADLVALLEQTALQELCGRPDNSSDQLVERVQSLIALSLQQGTPGAEQVAARLHCSVRHLHRQLARRNSNFRQLLNDTRLQLAKEYLGNAELSLADIAQRLAYSESSAFSRSFKQWTGMTPRDYRAAKGGQQRT